MLNIAKIQNSLVGLVGFRQPLNPDYAILNSSNIESISGYYVNDNPLAKIEFLKDCQDYKDISNVQFNEKLVQMQKSSISNVCNQVFNKADFLDRGLLYKYAFNKVLTDALPEGFVGYKIKIDEQKNVAFKISRVILDFSGTETIELLLWNTAKKEPIQTKLITIDSDHKEVVLDWTIDNTDTTYKGDYYIGYLTTGLTVEPYRRDYENSNQMSSFTYLTFEKVFVQNHNSNELFDLNEARFGISESLGLNFDVTIYEDYTDLVLNNVFLFSRAIYLDLIISFLQTYLASLRSNKNERIATELFQKVMLEIEGTRPDDNVISVKGLRPQLLTEVSTIKDEIDRLKESYFGIGIEVITQE